MAYMYRLLHQPSKSLRHADALSCCTLPSLVEHPAAAPSILLIEGLPAAPVFAPDVATLSAQDHTIIHILNWVWKGWLKGSVDPAFQPFISR